MTHLDKLRDMLREGIKQTIIQRPTKVKVNGENY